MSGVRLHEVEVLTRNIRKAQNDIEQFGDQRRRAILALRKEGVAVRRIANAMGTSVQTVYMEIQRGTSR